MTEAVVTAQHEAQPLLMGRWWFRTCGSGGSGASASSSGTSPGSRAEGGEGS